MNLNSAWRQRRGKDGSSLPPVELSTSAAPPASDSAPVRESAALSAFADASMLADLAQAQFGKTVDELTYQELRQLQMALREEKPAKVYQIAGRMDPKKFNNLAGSTISFISNELNQEGPQNAANLFAKSFAHSMVHDAEEFQVIYDYALNYLEKDGSIAWDESINSWVSKLPMPKSKVTVTPTAPETPADVEGIKPQQRQIMIDKLLDRWNKEVERRPQIEQQLKSLRAFAALWMVRRAEMVNKGDVVLWHGTTVDVAQKVLNEGVTPQWGKFVSTHHGEGGTPIVFASDDQDLSSAARAMMSAVAAKIGSKEGDVRGKAIREHGAMLEVVFDKVYQLTDIKETSAHDPNQESGWGVIDAKTGEPVDMDIPTGVEWGNFFSFDPGQVVGVHVGDDLLKFLGEHEEELSAFYGGDFYDMLTYDASVRSKWLQRRAGLPELPAEEYFGPEVIDKIMESNNSLWNDAVEGMALKAMTKLQEWNRQLWDENKAAEAVACAYGTGDVKVVYETPIMKAVLDQVMAWMKNTGEERQSLLNAWKRRADAAHGSQDGRGHDYDFGWDYEVQEKPDARLHEMTEAIAADLMKTLIPKLGMFGGFEIGYLENSGSVAVFIASTASYPMIGIDLPATQEAMADFPENYMVGALRTSIVHELAHAIQEFKGMPYNEEEAEGFARDYEDTGIITEFWKKKSPRRQRRAAAHDPAYAAAVKALCQTLTGKAWPGAESFPSLENFVFGGQNDGVIYFDGGYTRVLLDPREAEEGRMILKVAEIAKKSAPNWEAALPQRQALEKIASDYFKKITGGERQSLLNAWRRRAAGKIAPISWAPGTSASIDDAGQFFEAGEDHASAQNEVERVNGYSGGWVRLVSSEGFPELGLYKTNGTFTDAQWNALKEAIGLSDNGTDVWIADTSRTARFTPEQFAASGLELPAFVAQVGKKTEKPKRVAEGADPAAGPFKAPWPDQIQAFMQAVYDATQAHPFTRGQRVWNDEVILEVHPWAGGQDREYPWIVNLKWLQSMTPGKGNARACLQWLSALADEYGVFLELEAKPTGTPKIPKKKLINLYKDEGFESKDRPEDMQRQPLSAAWRSRRAGDAPGRFEGSVRGEEENIAQALAADVILPACREIEKKWAKGLNDLKEPVKLSINGVWLVGSRLSGNARPKSDWDFVITYTINGADLDPQSEWFGDTLNQALQMELRLAVIRTGGAGMAEQFLDFFPVYGTDPGKFAPPVENANADPDAPEEFGEATVQPSKRVAAAWRSRRASGKCQCRGLYCMHLSADEGGGCNSPQNGGSFCDSCARIIKHKEGYETQRVEHERCSNCLQYFPATQMAGGTCRSCRPAFTDQDDVECSGCGRSDLPLHTDGRCPGCSKNAPLDSAPERAEDVPVMSEKQRHEQIDILLDRWQKEPKNRAKIEQRLKSLRAFQALFSLRVAARKPKWKLVQMDPRLLVPYEVNQDPAKVQAIIKAYQGGQMLEPLTAVGYEGGEVELRDGHHRMLAAHEMGLKQVPVVLFDPDAYERMNGDEGMSDVLDREFWPKYKKERRAVAEVDVDAVAKLIAEKFIPANADLEETYCTPMAESLASFLIDNGYADAWACGVGHMFVLFGGDKYVADVFELGEGNASGQCGPMKAKVFPASAVSSDLDYAPGLEYARELRHQAGVRRASSEQKLLRELVCTVVGSDTGTTNEAVLPKGTIVGVQPQSNDHTIFFYSPFYSKIIVRGRVMKSNQYSAPVQEFRAATDIGYGEGTGYEHEPDCFCDDCMAKDDLTTHRCPTCGSRECPGDGHSIDCRKPGTMTLKDVPTETRDSLLDKFNRGEIDEATLRRRMKQLHSSLLVRWMARRADDINLFHGTSKQFDEVDTERGELGSHWGTPEQANEVLDEGGNLDTKHLEPKKRDKHLREMRHMRVIPADIDIKNPLRLVDKGHFDPHSIADQLIRLGIITQEQWDDGIYLLENWKDQNRVLQAAIVNAGYDGVVYLNRREGIGDRITSDGMPPFHDIDDEEVSDEVFLKYFPQAHDSYIVFEPTQIRHKWAARRAARKIDWDHVRAVAQQVRGQFVTEPEKPSKNRCVEINKALAQALRAEYGDAVALRYGPFNDDRGGEFHHWWVEVGGRVIDAAADQFNSGIIDKPMPEIYVGPRAPRYRAESFYSGDEIDKKGSLASAWRARRAGDAPGRFEGDVRGEVDVVDDDSLIGAKTALFGGGDALVVFFDTPRAIRIQSIQSSDAVRGRDILAWLKNTYGKPIVADEVWAGAEGFWEAMQAEGLVLSWSEKAFKRNASERNPDRDQALFDFQDSQIEPLPKQLQNIEESNILGIRLENAGDIFRELVWRDDPDPGYIGEKVGKITRYLNNPKMTAEMPSESKALLDQVVSLFQSIDTSGKSPVLRAAVDLNIALAMQDMGRAGALLPAFDAVGQTERRAEKNPDGSVNWETVEAIAEQARALMVETNPDANSRPLGMCGVANDALAQELVRLGLSVDMVWGMFLMDYPGYEGDYNENEDGTRIEAEHAWLEVEGRIVDIAADQFNQWIDGDYPPVYISDGRDHRFEEAGRKKVQRYEDGSTQLANSADAFNWKARRYFRLQSAISEKMSFKKNQGPARQSPLAQENNRTAAGFHGLPDLEKTVDIIFRNLSGEDKKVIAELARMRDPWTAADLMWKRAPRALELWAPVRGRTIEQGEWWKAAANRLFTMVAPSAIGVEEAPTTVEQVPTMNSRDLVKQRDKMLDEALEHPEGSPLREKALERLRSFGSTWKARRAADGNRKPSKRNTTSQMVNDAIINLLRNGPSSISQDLHEIPGCKLSCDDNGKVDSWDEPFSDMVSQEIGRMLDRGEIVFDGDTAEFSLLKNPEPTAPEHVLEMGGPDIQNRIDALLDQFSNEADPKKRKQIEQRLMSLRASRGAIDRRAGYKDWSASYLFDPQLNPVPFPKPGQFSGLWGSVYKSDLDELLFLVDNTQDLHDEAWRLFKKNPEVADQGLIALMPVSEHPEVIPFLKKVFNQINLEYVYPNWGKQAPEAGHEDDQFYSGDQWRGQAKSVVRILKGVYGDDNGPVELEKFLARLKPGEREDFIEEAGQDDFTSFLSGLQDIVDRSNGVERTKPSRKTEMTTDDVAKLPEVDVQSETDKLLEQLQVETDPAKKQQIMERLRSLRASLMDRWMQRTADVASRIPVLIKQFYPDEDPDAAEAHIRELALLDPTGEQGKYLTWLVKNDWGRSDRYKADSGVVKGHNDNVKSLLAKYEKVKNKGGFPKEAKDINKLTFDQLEKVVTEFGGLQSQRELKLSGQRVVRDDASWKITEITTVESASTVCKGKAWCVKDPRYSENYLARGPLYFVEDVDQGEEYLIHPASGEVKDEHNDTPVSEAPRLKEELADDPHVGSAINNMQIDVEDILRCMDDGTYDAGDIPTHDLSSALDLCTNEFENYGYHMHEVIGEMMKRDLQSLISDYRFAMNVTTRKNNPQEARSQGEQALVDAVSVNELGEAVLASDNARMMAQFATEVLKARWPQAEPAIMAQEDAKHIYTSVFPEDEALVPFYEKAPPGNPPALPPEQGVNRAPGDSEEELALVTPPKPEPQEPSRWEQSVDGLRDEFESGQITQNEFEDRKRRITRKPWKLPAREFFDPAAVGQENWENMDTEKAKKFIEEHPGPANNFRAKWHADLPYDMRGEFVANLRGRWLLRRAGEEVEAKESRSPGGLSECNHHWPGKKKGEKGWCGRCGL